ncbi:uncharacterized protein LOC18426769 isoform X2 [Amborella trichopoda]|uniref:uncharacterized protein LOC18426769 isoform X2 n=1 Tax=Amborella trichopoda TaxID=13333 RepID=UPI0009BE2080|nr:uncharacterized protein LOC18426769 isoform X2 [Amborella trichopoda]|eukprot:XP_020518354.1 uncharacterized protein LOC18426769 isoform X2 [Amborella trichopoda]
MNQRRVKPYNKSMFILGMGFVGTCFAHQLKSNGWEVFGTCTNENKKNKLEQMGFNMFTFEADKDGQEALSAIQDMSHLLISIPPVVGLGDPVLSLHQDFLRIILRDSKLCWLGYLSSTSVYGDCGGAWVDEESPTKPSKSSALARLAAEKDWLDLGRDLCVCVNILRLGGIYGPGRSAVDTIIKRKSLSNDHRTRESKRYTARVHVADISQAIKASMDLSSSGKIYNVVDDDPAPREEVFSFAYNLIEQKWPGKFTQAPMGSAPFKHLVGEKRVSNNRLKEELGVNLIYPSYKLGLQSIVETIKTRLISHGFW